jgi:hypothetical protein
MMKTFPKGKWYSVGEKKNLFRILNLVSKLVLEKHQNNVFGEDCKILCKSKTCLKVTPWYLVHSSIVLGNVWLQLKQKLVSFSTSGQQQGVVNFIYWVAWIDLHVCCKFMIIGDRMIFYAYIIIFRSGWCQWRLRLFVWLLYFSY